ncbi:MAG TPA: phage tail terminator-like protein [Bosea sp. (in: a-proteobacteria)]|jgi:hypothetical protein|uniref:phage tail terminator-like protein n=1 Tax=Bosea sp. (in: a-proteobacteria) TaxID=1871050 RepID=UPI002E0FA993|nr:phage tail terminator-like protein [Bosea sp. (in: a-proteobacteria)]
MASDVVYEAIRTYLSAAWSETPIEWENEAFNQPSDGWVAVEIAGTSYAQQSIGADDPAENRWDEDGILWLHVIVPTGTGSVTARRWAKQLADLFRGARLLSDDLEFLDASIGAGDRGVDEGPHWMITVSVDWRREEA